MRALSNHLLSLILCTPLAGALLVLLISSRRVAAIRWIANGCAAAALVLAVPLWFRYDPHGKTWQFAERGEWIPMVGASYYVGVDGFSILLILLAALIGWIAIFASWHEIQTRVKEFYALVLILQTGVLGIFMSLDFLQVFVFWQTVLVAMFFLIRIQGGVRPLRSAIRFCLYALAASLTILLGILVLYFFNHTVTGAYSFDITQLHTLTIPVAMQKWVFVAFVFGFGVTVALFPLHSWLPDARPDRSTAVSLIVAAVVLKMGTYGFIRFTLPILPDASRSLAPAIAILALVALAAGALFALAQRDWTRFVACSSVCHIAFVMLGMFALTPVGVTGSMLHQINHGISIAGLLLVVGMISQPAQQLRPATGELRTGLWKTTPVPTIVALIMTISLIGVPAVMIVRGVYAVNKPWAAVAVIAMVVVSAYPLWLYRRTMFAAVSSAPRTTLRDLTARERAMLVPLVAVALWIGLHPAPFVGRLETSMGRVVARVNPAYAPYVAQGSDCATPAPPEPSGPPPGFMLTESCADGSGPAAKPSAPDGSRR